MASKMYLCLNPQTYEHVVLDGKREFADVNKLRILRLGDHLDYPGRTNVTKRALIEKVRLKCQAKVRYDYANKFSVIQFLAFKDGG